MLGSDYLPDLPNDDSKEHEASQHQFKHGDGVDRPVHRHQEVNRYHHSESACRAQDGLEDETTLFMDGEIVKILGRHRPPLQPQWRPIEARSQAWRPPLAPFRPEERRCTPTRRLLN